VNRLGIRQRPRLVFFAKSSALVLLLYLDVRDCRVTVNRASHTDVTTYVRIRRTRCVRHPHGFYDVRHSPRRKSDGFRARKNDRNNKFVTSSVFCFFFVNRSERRKIVLFDRDRILTITTRGEHFRKYAGSRYPTAVAYLDLNFGPGGVNF